MLIQILFLMGISGAFANDLTAVPLQVVLEKLAKTEFKFVERNLVYGFQSIQSCLYSGENILVLKHYCYPAKKYPAKGWTLISPKWGILDIYEENLDEVQKRDLTIEVFPENFRKVVSGDITKIRIEKLNHFLEVFDESNDPACWTTNFSFYTNAAQSKCYREDIAKFSEWSTETMSIVGEDSLWTALIKRLMQIN